MLQRRQGRRHQAAEILPRRGGKRIWNAEKKEVIPCSEKRPLRFALLFVFLRASFAYGAPVVLKALQRSPRRQSHHRIHGLLRRKGEGEDPADRLKSPVQQQRPGGQREALESMQAGTLEMCMATRGHGPVRPRHGRAVPSYVFQSTEHMFKALNGKAGR